MCKVENCGEWHLQDDGSSELLHTAAVDAKSSEVADDDIIAAVTL